MSIKNDNSYYTGWEGRGAWAPHMGGRIAEALGIDTSRPPSDEAMARLFECKRADTGEAWSNKDRNREISGFDFTASPDKSVTLAAKFAATKEEEALLGPYRGFLHADGYGGFTRFYKPITPLGDAPLVEVACWSHARRHFYDVRHQTASPIGLVALHQIAALFAVESHIRGKPPNRRATPRREHAQPRLERLKQFLETELLRVSGKSSLAEAIRYALSRWKALTRSVTDGGLEMSNNAVERAMKPPVLGRKNYLFCGSDAGGQRAACMYTIVETCKMNGINPRSI